jgi:hypothetical protein
MTVDVTPGSGSVVKLHLPWSADILAVKVAYEQEEGVACRFMEMFGGGQEGELGDNLLLSSLLQGSATLYVTQ